MKDGFNSKYKNTHHVRFTRTLQFMENKVQKNEKILDIGPDNPLSDFLRENGYNIVNTPENTDLDINYKVVNSFDYEVCTAFEIFEHLVSPFTLLKEIKSKKLVASVPLRLWFSTAYWNENDEYDRHYHEFEPRQFDMLLDKAGWKIIHSDKWISKSRNLGIRPILRNFTPRYYIVYCERK